MQSLKIDASSNGHRREFLSIDDGSSLPSSVRWGRVLTAATDSTRRVRIAFCYIHMDQSSTKGMPNRGTDRRGKRGSARILPESGNSTTHCSEKSMFHTSLTHMGGFSSPC